MGLVPKKSLTPVLYSQYVHSIITVSVIRVLSGKIIRPQRPSLLKDIRASVSSLVSFSSND